MKVYSKGIALLFAAVVGSAIVTPTYAFPNFGNFGTSTVQVQTDSNSGGNGVSADNNGNANGNSVNSGNSNAQTTVCTTQNSNGNPNCPQPTQPTTQPTSAPTPTPGSGGGSNGGGSNGGDGRSDGLSSCPGCTAGPGSSGQVLGASTFAGTGTFEQNLMNAMLIAGTSILLLGGLSLVKERK